MKFFPILAYACAISLALPATLYSADKTTLPQVTPSATQSDAHIRSLLQQRIDQHKRSLGIVVGIVTPQGRRFISYGRVAQGEARAPDEHSLFEIGSVSKVLTALLLAEMVSRGEVSLHDPVANYLPKKVKLAPNHGREISLLDLAQHSSGLPLMPDNIDVKDPVNPLPLDKMYKFLSFYESKPSSGKQFSYSNLGVALLGQALARRAGSDYEALVMQRVTLPLGMQHTAIVLKREMQAQMVTGHNAALEAVPHSAITSLVPAGGWISNADDLLTLLAAQMQYSESSLQPALQAMLEPRFATPNPALQIGLAWHILKKGDTEIIFHSGATEGFRSFVGFNPASKVGVVILSNTATPEGGDDIGMHLLNPSMPLLSAPAPK